MTKLRCFIDGNALCIVKEDFTNLQESEAVFITLGEFEMQAIKKLESKPISWESATQAIENECIKAAELAGHTKEEALSCDNLRGEELKCKQCPWIKKIKESK